MALAELALCVQFIPLAGALPVSRADSGRSRSLMQLPQLMTAFPLLTLIPRVVLRFTPETDPMPARLETNYAD